MKRNNFRSFLVLLTMTSALAGTGGVSAGGPLTDEQIQQREQAILGLPPRIAPLEESALSGENRIAVEGLRKSLGVKPLGEGGKVPEFFLTMLKHPQLMKQQANLSAQLFSGELSVRDREIAILRTGWLNQAPYEWGQHVDIAKQLGGLSREEVERITVGSSAAGWNEHERAILRAVEELHSDSMISSDTWAALAKELNEAQLLELPVLVGVYQSIAYLQNSVGFRLDNGKQGLMAR